MNKVADSRNDLGRILVVSAPSGAGKTTICRFIVQKYPEFELSVSHTTRKPRGEEVNGRDYFFVSEEEFERMIEQDAFVEYARVYDRYYYGTSWASIESILQKGKNALLDIDVQGASQIKKRFAQAELLFILPPSYEVLAKRLYERKTDDPEEIARRLAQAKKEIARFEMFDFVIINDDLEEAKAAVSLIVEQRPERERFAPQNMKDAIAHLLNGSSDVGGFETGRNR